MRFKLKEKVIALITLVSISAPCISANAPKVKPLWVANEQKNKIAVISDLHLGIDDNYAETVENRKYLVDFLQRLQTTKDVKELVIIGDFLDMWFLPYSYTGKITDENKFYRDVIKNNQIVVNELKRVIKSGIKLVYVPGNHDLTLKTNILEEAIPGIIQIKNEPQGIGTYYTGNHKDIAIEHGHRYDIFSAPDCISNKELCGNDNTILPAGYFYAINAASWVIEGRPKVTKNYPKIEKPVISNEDQAGAWAYYSTIARISQNHTPIEDQNAKLFKMHFAGFNDDYSFMDFYPQMQPDGTISGKLYKNIQSTWDERQVMNKVNLKTPFLEALKGAVDPAYFHKQARVQYFENPNEKVDIVIFGHTHIPDYKEDNGKIYVNDGTWVDHNSDGGVTRTFTIVTDNEKPSAKVYTYEKDGIITDITENALNNKYYPE